MLANTPLPVSTGPKGGPNRKFRGVLTRLRRRRTAAQRQVTREEKSGMEEEMKRLQEIGARFGRRLVDQDLTKGFWQSKEVDV